MEEPSPLDRPRRTLFQKLRTRFRRLKGALRPGSSSRQLSQRPKTSFGTGLTSRLTCHFRPDSPPIGPGHHTRTSPELLTSPGPSDTNIPPTELRISTGDMTWSRVRDSLNSLESITTLFQPLKDAVSELVKCLDVVQEAASNREDYEQFGDELRGVVDVLRQDANKFDSDVQNGSVANLAQSIRIQVASIKAQKEGKSPEYQTHASSNQKDTIDHYKEIVRLFQKLQHDLSLRKHTKSTPPALQEILPAPVDNAMYDSYYQDIIRQSCIGKAHETTLQTLQNWSIDPEREKIYWIYGRNGTGKTTIAYSFFGWLAQTNRLGARFSCSAYRSLSLIVPNIAYQLAHFSPAYFSMLCASFQDSSLSGIPEARGLNVVRQFEKLISQPMLNAKDAMPDSVVIVIDALEQCDDNYSMGLLLDVLVKSAEQLPLKFFVSSRPEPSIRDCMMSQGGSLRSIIYSHDIEQSIEEDIGKYFIEAFSPMKPPPSLAQVKLLARYSRDLNYASAVVRYIDPEDFYADSSARLELMLKTIGYDKAMSDDRYDGLDLLHTTMLSAIFNERLEEGERVNMQRVLWAVVCAREPVATVTIASLAGLSESQVWFALQSLRSVLDIPEGHGLISTLHASLPDYLFDPSRSKEFYCDKWRLNEAIVHRCFDVMKSELKFNICELESSYLMDHQVDGLKARITRYISPTLSYACRHWSSHLEIAPALDNTCDITRDMLLDFLSNRLLFWMEVLNVDHHIGSGASMMRQAQAWVRARVGNNCDEIQKQLSDACNFITLFALSPCSQSTPHIYISALSLFSKSNWVYQHYFQRTKGLASISVNRYDEAMTAIRSPAGFGILSIAVSPEGGYIAVGNPNSRIQVYDMHTGTWIADPFHGHTRAVNSVAFSPDGRQIASGSYDSTMIVWDALTGRIVIGPLHKHSRAVNSVAFSPDGGRVVSGSADETIVVWDIYTGTTTLGPLQGHSGSISSVAFSPNGQLIASGSLDESIMLWNASTGVTVTKLIGHKGPVLTIAFSPDGTHLASGSGDKTIRVWDVGTGALAMQPLECHTSAVMSVAFSSDGTRLATSGNMEDNSIIIWYIPTGSVLVGPFRGHTDSVNSAVFSPDGTRVISCSDDGSIRIWDTGMRDDTVPQRQIREISLGPMAFSPDCSRFISSSSCGALRAWDLHTGNIVSPMFELQTELPAIHAVAFSPDGIHVAASTNDFIIRIWDTVTGQASLHPFKGHTGKVGCVVFSPDGAQLCSGSDDATIRLWDIYTGMVNHLPCDGHTDLTQCVAYSSNGTNIASGSTDATIRVWDLSTYAMTHVLSGHTGPVESVVFSPDGSIIISGGSDGTIQKWDIAKGANHSTLFEQSSGSVQSTINLNADFPTLSPEANSLKASNAINCLSYSADGTRLVAGFNDGIRILDPQTGQVIHALSTPENQVVRWAGFAPNGTSVISALATRNHGLQIFLKQAPQKSSKSPNIIHVWDAGMVHWSQQDDGWLMAEGNLVLWLPFNLRQYLDQYQGLVPSRPGHLDNMRALLFDDLVEFQCQELCIGSGWSECYTHQG